MIDAIPSRQLSSAPKAAAMGARRWDILAMRAWAVAASLSLTLAAAPGCTKRVSQEEVSAVSSPREGLPPAEAARAALKVFLEAAGKGDFATAHALLAEPLRQRYDARRLEEDFARDPSALARLQRTRGAADVPASVTASSDQSVVFPHERGQVRLVLEPGGYRVAALE